MKCPCGCETVTDGRLDLYPTDSVHGEATIVGDVEALTALRDACNLALERGAAFFTAFPSNHEAHLVTVGTREGILAHEQSDKKPYCTVPFRVAAEDDGKLWEFDADQFKDGPVWTGIFDPERVGDEVPAAWVGVKRGQVENRVATAQLLALLEPPVASEDNCQVCHGAKGGVRGNENIVDGVGMCDYCHAEDMERKGR